MKAQFFKILVISMLLKNNKMSDGGSIHSEDEFASPVNDLISEGFIAPCDEDGTLFTEGEGTDGNDSFDLDSMDQNQLLDFAKVNDIKVGNTRNVSKLRSIISEELINSQGGDEEGLDYNNLESFDFEDLTDKQLNDFAEFQQIDLDGVEDRNSIIETLNDWKQSLSE